MSISKRMMEMEEDVPEPVAEAFTDREIAELDDSWLGEAEEADQINAMRVWFLARYCDPALETPYSSDAGGYIYVDGGPYDPFDELYGRFDGVVDEEVIQKLADELHDMHYEEWAPTRLTSYNQYEDVFVDERNQPTQRLEARLAQLRSVLALAGDDDAKAMSQNMIYASVISALETFLWETMVYWVEHSNQVVENLVKSHPTFRDRKISLGTIFDAIKTLKVDVRAHLQHVVWHRWEDVIQLYRHGLGVTLPSVRAFQGPLQARHDIVHRSGQTEDGQAVNKTEQDIDWLCIEVLRYANEVDPLIAGKNQEEIE